MLFGVATTLKVIPYALIRICNALGILFYLGTGIVTMLFGRTFLSYDVLCTHRITSQKMGIFFVELVVALTVCSSMLMIYISFVSRKE